MNREEALRLIRSNSDHERLKAARFFARNAEDNDLVTLREANRRETVSYVKTNLRLALERIALTGLSEEEKANEESEVKVEALREVRSKAVDWVATLLLHEISSCVGLVANSASQEIASYDDSRTKRHLDRLRTVLEGVAQLKGATTVPARTEFDLAPLVDEAILDETSNNEVDVRPHGPRPMNVKSDRSLLQHALHNGLRNSIEATLECSPENRQAVVVTWGETDVDYWVTIIDHGRGLSAPAERVFDIGKTTKKGHSGFGLAIARQAMDTLNGSISLQPSSGGGTLFELRWER
jgi:signal transduction histidine kinase